MRLAWIATSLVCFFPSALAAQQRCSRERGAVKIWADRDSAMVDTVPIPMPIAQLVQVPRPKGPFPPLNRVGDAEFKTFVVRGRVMAVLPEDDSDIHVVLRDLESDKATLVTEIPHPSCTANARLARLYDDARRALRTVPRDGVVEVVGIGFFDTLHGVRGMQPNGLELHPVLRLRVISPSPAKRPAGPLK